MLGDKEFHTVRLDSDRCKGCINCMKRCPTEAIRVRDGKAAILYDRCIGCGECIRACAHQAKRAVYDPFELIYQYEYKVALPAPSLYGQFHNLDDINVVLEGLLKLGFDMVYEVAQGAELISDFTRRYMAGNPKKPVISSACPAVVELILIRFHRLKENLLPVIAPVDAAAKLAREKAARESGLPPEKIGVFFISPCPAKVFALHRGLGADANLVDGVLAESEVYFRLLDAMKSVKNPRPLAQCGIVGIGWASSGGESAGVLRDNYLAADGVENCISVLEEIEDEKIQDVDFVELNACPGGCVGGVLNIENPFVAKARIQALRKYMPVSKNTLREIPHEKEFFLWNNDPEIMPVFKLDDNMLVALQKMQKVEELLAALPRLDCGACGAPSCRAFAEDVVNGLVPESACERREKRD